MPTTASRRAALATALLVAALAPAGSRADDRLEFHPFASLSVGMGMAQDNATVNALSLATVELDGVAALGPLFGVNVGLDLRYGALLAGVRFGYQRSWLRQSLDLRVLGGETLHASGSLDESLVLVGRIGGTVSTVPVYLTGGWVWSWASSSLQVAGLPPTSDTLAQDGGVVGLGVQPAIGGGWFLELEYLVFLYRQVRLPTLLDPLVDVQVRSVDTSFTASIGYRF